MYALIVGMKTLYMEIRNQKAETTSSDAKEGGVVGFLN